MLKSDLVQTDKYSIKILLQRKNHNTKPLNGIMSQHQVY